jgi:hypothetical protein
MNMIKATQLRALLAGLGVIAIASSAHAADLCQLAVADTFAKASSALEAAGCSVASEQGTGHRTFACEGSGWAQLDESSFVSIVLPGSVPLQATGRCGGQGWSPSKKVYDNPLVKNVFELGSYVPDAQIAIMSLDQKTPFLTWICASKYGCFSSGFDRGLKTVMKRYLGDDTLEFRSSEIRVAGVDITTATRATIERELTGRGAVLTSHDGGPLITRSTFGQVSGVPGLSSIELAYLGERVTTVRYPIATEGDFSGLARSLDERYGVSTATAGKGCTTRSWANGGVTILGELCAAKPERSGFLFINTGAAAIVKGLDQLVANPIATVAKPASKAKTDMY